MARKVKEYPEISLKPQDLDGAIDFARIFGRSAPVHIEIGCGKGTFLVGEARACPELNFMGIERANRYYRYAVDRMGRWGLKNVRIIRTDAAEFLRDFVADASVSCFHIYFPDPWPKRRHHKRRLFRQGNVEQLIRCLAAGGVIDIATDHAEYFNVITEIMGTNKMHLVPTEFIRPAGAEKNEWVGTNFERKYIKQAKQIFAAAWKKRSPCRSA